MIEIVCNNVLYVNPSREQLINDGFSSDDINAAFNTEKWRAIRIKRESLLKGTDWTLASDTPLSVEKVDEFKVYRQALRDIPQTYSNPDDVVWPTKPTI